jgi:hypothetical protein
VLYDDANAVRLKQDSLVESNPVDYPPRHQEAPPRTGRGQSKKHAAPVLIRPHKNWLAEDYYIIQRSLRRASLRT